MVTGHHEISIRYSRKFTDCNITTVVKSVRNRLVAFGTEEGILNISIYTSAEDILGDELQTVITGSQIVDVEWVGTGVVSIAVCDENVYLYDIVKDVKLLLYGHRAPVECIKNMNENIFFSGGKDGYVYGWDKRCKRPCFCLNHFSEDNKTKTSSDIKSIEFNDRETMIMYTSSTHEGRINVWDLRCLGKGKLFLNSNTVSEKQIGSLKYCKNNLYGVGTDSSLFRISQSGSCYGNIQHPLSAEKQNMIGKLGFNEYLGLLFYVCNGTFFHVIPDAGKIHISDIGSLKGAISLEFETFLGYDSQGNIFDFALYLNNIFEPFKNSKMMAWCI